MALGEQVTKEFFEKVEERLKKHFVTTGDSGGLKVENFVPSTGIGRFDASYHPTNNRLDITVNASYDFTDIGSDTPWLLSEQDQFKKDAKRLIEEGWSDRYLITCSKPGWLKFYARVNVNFNEVSKGRESYIVRVIRLAKPKSSGGIDHGVFPHVCGVNNWANELDEFKRLDHLFNFAEGRIRGGLRDMTQLKDGDFFAFPANIHELSVDMRLRLAKFATLVNTVRTDDLRGIRAFTIALSGRSDSILKFGLGDKRANAVAEFLNAKVRHGDFAKVTDKGSSLHGVKDALQVLKQRTNNPSNGAGGVLLVIGTPKDVVREVPRKYVVMLHEFGHMLGLPDEYMGPHSEKTISKMQLDSIVPSTYIAAKANTGNERLKKMQERLLKEIETSGVVSPLFMGTSGIANLEEMKEYSKKSQEYGDLRSEMRKKTGGGGAYESWKARNPEPKPPTDMTMVSSSIMHSGGDILPAHYITIWSSLCKITAGYVDPDQWKIVPTDTRPSTIGFFK